MPRTRDRLTQVDSSFLACEGPAAHMHISAVWTFEGPTPDYDDILTLVESRLHLVPRLRQHLAFAPLSRPVWADDPCFNLEYHVRLTMLPPPGSDEQLCNLAGRVISQQLDRDKALWELWVVDGHGDGFAVVFKAHHALLDGVALVDLAAILLDAQQVPRPVEPEPWTPFAPRRGDLVVDAVRGLAAVPPRALGGVGALARRPRATVGGLVSGAGGAGVALSARLRRAPSSPLNGRIGPHRGWMWIESELREVVRAGRRHGATVNDVALAAVSLAVGRNLRRRGVDPDGLVLRVLVPRSVRAEDERGALGNRIAGMVAPLPVGVSDPDATLRTVRDTMTRLKRSSQSSGVRVVSAVGEYAPARVGAVAARLAARMRPANLVVTNIVGPTEPLFFLGRRMTRFLFVPPLSAEHLLSVGISSYDGRLGLGVIADYDSFLHHEFAGDLQASLYSLTAPRSSGRTPGQSVSSS